MLNEKMVALGTQRSVIRELFEFGKQRAAVVGAENVFDFSIGNPSVPSPAVVNEVAMKMLQEMDPVILHGYTSAQGDAVVRSKIVDSLNKRFNGNYRPENLYMTVGAAAALSCCLTGLCNPGDEVIVLAPFFPEYRVFVAQAGASMKVIEADIEAFQINFEALEAAITDKTKAIIVNSPNNPSGTVYSKETIEKLTTVLEEASNKFGHPIYLLSDEPYREIVFKGVEVPFIPQYYKNTLVCYSWSKSLSLPGERMGYVLVPDQVDDSENVYAAVAGAGRSLGYVNAPSLFQRVCAECVDVTADVAVYEENKNLLVPALRDMGFECVEPEGTFYMFPRTLIADDVAFCNKAKDFDLLIVPGTGFGCSGHARISYCVPTERAKRSLDAFEKLAKFYK